MQTDRWQKIEEIFNRAVALSATERAEFVVSACEGDKDLRREVQELLEADAADENPLDEDVLTLALECLEHDDVLPAGAQIAHYRIEKLLGRGGMGAVYLAQDTRLERPVALKFLPAHFAGNRQNIERFRQEARAASAISHPNVAHIYEFGAEGERYFLAMEYIEGKTLRDLLRERAVDAVRSLEIARQIAEALAATHRRGIIHRDIKPENIIITEGGLVKVLDFGVAKLSGRQTPEQKVQQLKISLVDTVPGTIMGTIGYISPEQLEDKKADFRTDIWSLGVVLYEMLAGRKPFEEKNAAAIGKAILKKNPPPVSVSGITDADEAALKNIISRALKKSPAKRYQSAGDLANDLKKLKQNLEHARQSSSGEITAGSDFSFDSGTFERRTQNFTFLTKTKQFWNNQSLSRKGLLLAAIIGVLTFCFGFAAQYLSRRDESGMAENPSQITYLTRDGRIKDVAVSGDGRRLAYVPVESEKNSLWIRDLETGSEKQLLPSDFVRYWGMRFLPGGESLLYVRSEPGGAFNSLYRIAANGGQPEKIISNIANPPAISPDGAKIAFIRTDPEKHQDALVIAGIDGGGEKEIAWRRFPETFPTSSAAWSPDGKIIAVGIGRGETENALAAISLDGTQMIELTPWRWAAYGGAAWESDGRGLIFSAREKGMRALRIWRLQYPNGELRALTDEANAFEEVTLSDNTIVTLRTYEVSDIWAFDLAGAPRRLTTQGSEGADGLTVTPAGQIVYTQGEYEQSFLWRMNTDGSDRRRLTNNTGFLPAASRDNRFISYVSTESGTHHIWLMETDGQNNRQLTDGAGENYPTFTPDGNWIIYTALGKNSGTLWKIPTGGGKGRQLTFDGFTIKPQVSPDGTMIACTYRRTAADDWKIIVLPIAGGKPLKTLNLPNARAQMLRWTADSRSLIFVDKQNGAQNLWRQPLDGKPPTQITNFTEDQILHYDTLADDSQLILSRGGRRRDIAVIKNYK